jgi:hypothetical protein
VECEAVVARLRAQTLERYDDLSACVRAYYSLSQKLRERYAIDNPSSAANLDEANGTNLDLNGSSFIDSVRAPFVLTHGDALGLNLIRRHGSDCASLDGLGALVIVDWDSILLAPCERDLWFFLSDNPEQCLIASQIERSQLRYDQFFPSLFSFLFFATCVFILSVRFSFRIDWDCYAYYLVTRFLGDWYEFVAEILPNGINGERTVSHMETCLQGLEKDCYGWTGELLKSLMDNGRL